MKCSIPGCEKDAVARCCAMHQAEKCPLRPAKPKGQKEAYSPEFETLWSAYPKREGEHSKKAAWKAYRARLRDGMRPEYLIRCVEEYARAMQKQGRLGTEFVLQAVTFLGPNERYKGYEPKPAVETPARPPLATPRNGTAEERVDGRPFIKEILKKLAGRRSLP